jgi:hypothetical protein
MGATHMKKQEKPAREHRAVKYLPIHGNKIVTAKDAKEIREKYKEKPLDELAEEYGLDPMLVFKIVHGVTVKVFGEKKHVK